MDEKIEIEWNKRWEKDYIIANTLEEYKSHMGFVVRDLLDELNLAICDLKVTNKKILDIGGGYGAILKILFNDTNEKYLVDISVSGIKLAKEIYKIENAYALDFVNEEFPINEEFDIVLLNEVIEHLPPVDHIRLVEKIYSVLKPNGKIIITTPNIASLTSRVLLLFGRIPVTFRLDSTHISVFTTTTLDHLLKDNGFNNIRIKTTQIRFLPFNLNLPIRFKLGEHIVGIWEKKSIENY